MVIIKRYPNRKLYNTEARQYITLTGIATLIRQGEEVQVVDHATGEDLTALTLTQIIVEQEKKEGGFLPQSVLTGLVQAGGDTLTNLRRSLTNPLGLLRQIDEEIEQRLHRLVEQGELAREEAQRLLDKLLAQGRQLGAPMPSEQDIERALAERDVPTGTDMQQLADQLKVLATKLDSLTHEAEMGPSE